MTCGRGSEAYGCENKVQESEMGCVQDRKGIEIRKWNFQGGEKGRWSADRDITPLLRPTVPDGLRTRASARCPFKHGWFRDGQVA